jgi:hypothetical protein
MSLVGAYNWSISNRLNNEVRGGYQKSNPFFNTSGLPSDFFISLPLTDSPENSFLSQGRTTKLYNIQDNAVTYGGITPSALAARTTFTALFLSAARHCQLTFSTTLTFQTSDSYRRILRECRRCSRYPILAIPIRSLRQTPAI